MPSDGFGVSGHRRHCAAKLAGLESVRCQVMDVRRGGGDTDEYVKLLRAYNLQRLKDSGEQFRESVVDSDPEEVYRALLREREQSLVVRIEPMEVRERATRRKAIGRLKRPFLDAVIETVNGLWKYWPLSDRQIHYQMLNVDVLRNANRDDSKYRNDEASYKDLVDILTRAG